MMQITDAQYETYCERGFLILPRYLPEETRAEAAAALRRCLRPWEEVKDNPPPGLTATHGFPYPEPLLNRLTIEPGLVAFARRALGSEDIHFRAGLSIVRYPGFQGDYGEPHIDNGNNSLLPPTESDPGYAQLTCWWHLEDVEADQAPLRIIPKIYGNDTSQYESVLVPGGSLCLFNNYMWHSAGNYARADGQRYSWGYMFGRAGHYWEGFMHYTNAGRNPHFQQLIGSLTPKERELFRFPPVGHPYYTPQTLAALEQQYPGWNAADYL
ncbi:MAG TPA: phytanoyl-CoA dioxygenase family protein [Abditibacteriaceae bacterium]|nr:phytanoyl-CoA dioxygenase family protein [Abditibacteriaceae bacterium]